MRLTEECYQCVSTEVHFDNYLAAPGMSLVGVICILGCSFLLVLSLDSANYIGDLRDPYTFLLKIKE